MTFKLFSRPAPARWQIAANVLGSCHEQALPAAGPGVQALIASSTDILIADVLETSPRRAVEGARDTVKLKVVRSLLGRPTAGDSLGVYYHLLWKTDEQGGELEPLKFVSTL